MPRKQKKIVIPPGAVSPGKPGLVGKATSRALESILESPRNLDPDEARHIIAMAKLPGERKDMLLSVDGSNVESWTINGIRMEVVGPITGYKNETRVYVVRLAESDRTPHPYQSSALARVIGIVTHNRLYDTWVAFDPILVPSPGVNRDGSPKDSIASSKIGALKYFASRLDAFNKGEWEPDVVLPNPSFDGIMIYYLREMVYKNQKAKQPV